MPRIRAVTFNIRHGRRGDASGAVDVDLLGRCTASLGADLLALQEVDVGAARSGRVDQARAVEHATGLSAVFGQATRLGPGLGLGNGRGAGRYGNALLARGSLAEVEVLALVRDSRRHERRSAILATVSIDGTEVSVAATHLSTHASEAHRQLVQLVASLAERPPPRILLGDMNLGPDEVAPVVGQAGMTLAGGGASFPAHRPRARIDHVAASGLAVGAAEVVPTPCSDHRAVAVGLG